MTHEEYAGVRPVIEMAQRLHGSLNRHLRKRGVLPIDALIAATYAAHHSATELHGNPVAAVEWMRDALDVIEQRALAEERPN
jgi:hypothetical protein